MQLLWKSQEDIFMREHAYVLTHAHIQDLSIPFQIATFGKEYEAVNTMTIYFFHDNSAGFIDIC